MGKTVTPLILTNFIDVENASSGALPPGQVRRFEVEGLVDTGAMELAIPAELASALGAPVIGHRGVRFADGRTDRVPYVGGLLIEILGRQFQGGAYVLPAGSTILIGQIPLEHLDLVVKPATREVIVNPDHPDGPISEMYRLSA
jgi:clan AA aspartic protease